MATQSRLDNLHSGTSFTGKPEQVVESNVKPLMDNEKFETQLAAIKPTKRARVRRLFRERQQIEGCPSPVSSSTATAPIAKAAATRLAPNASPTQAWPDSTKRIYLFYEKPTVSPKRYPDGASTTNIASSAIQAEAQPRGPPDPDEGAYRAGILDKHGQFRADPLSENHTPCYDHRQQGDVLESSNIKDPRPTKRSRKTDKRWEDVAQILSELYRKGTSDVESTILEGPFEEMEWSVVPSGNPRNRDIHRRERYCLGCRYWPQELLSFMENIRGNTPHQLKGATCRSNCIETERSGGPYSGKPMGPMPEDEYQATSNVCSVSSELGGCTEPLNGNDRMVTFEQSILPIGKEVREARRGPLCISDQQEDTKILQLVSGPPIYRTERAEVQLGRLEAPLLLPALELDCTDSPEDEARADYNDCNYTRMKVRDLVSGNVSTIDFTATNSTSN
ncbi:hypothetical protein AYI70_g9314 [Smittium culicis]|uniref:Uncharacterized protein n=1 Tax=Smittium culicis TaxID=133412 RepID=A0A1R1XBU1_9FUNG|nr:hypothetical protein AYI70_g9314 [Smittium culicis]